MKNDVDKVLKQSHAMITHAFTCTGPYAVLILLGIKRVENRGARAAADKGRCAISCSKSFNKEEFGNFVQWASRTLSPQEFEMIPSWNDVKDWPGKVVGVCDYSASETEPLVLEGDATTPHLSWDEGLRYWWSLSNVVAFDNPIPCRGNPGMWEMPTDLASQVNAADVLAQSIGKTIATAADAVRIFSAALPIVRGNEGFFVLTLDEHRRTLAAPILVSLGTETTAAIHAGEVFGEALKYGAKSIVVAHNHPSGNTTPSAADKQLTAVLKQLGSVLGVGVLDHLILGKDTFMVID